MTCYDAMDGHALISGIALSKGAELELHCGVFVNVNNILSGTSATYLSNLLSPTFMEYRANPSSIRLSGPNGIASFHYRFDLDIPFEDFPGPLSPVSDSFTSIPGYRS